MSKKFVDMWGWSEYHKFLSDFFCLTTPKNFKKKPSTVALVLGIEISYDKGGYVTISCRFFCLAVPKKFVEEPFCAVFQESSVSQKCVYKRGGRVSIFFRRKFVPSQCRNFSYWNPLMFLHFRGLCHELLSIFFCLAVTKNIVGEPFSAVLQKSFLSKNSIDKRWLRVSRFFHRKFIVS